MKKIPALFGSMVFNESVMKERLTKDAYRALCRTIREGEALDPAGAPYSEERLRALFRGAALEGKPLAEQLSLLRGDIAAFAAGAEQADDITMLLLKINETKGREEPHG